MLIQERNEMITITLTLMDEVTIEELRVDGIDLVHILMEPLNDWAFEEIILELMLRDEMMVIRMMVKVENLIVQEVWMDGIAQEVLGIRRIHESVNEEMGSK